VSNPFCVTQDLNGQCLSCYLGAYFSYPYCLVASSSCTTFNAVGQCLTCEPGYEIFQGICTRSLDLNPLCVLYNGTSCSKCVYGYYVNNEKCSPASALCYIYNPETGVCNNCYDGYALVNNECLYEIISSYYPNCTNITNGIMPVN